MRDGCCKTGTSVNRGLRPTRRAVWDVLCTSSRAHALHGCDACVVATHLERDGMQRCTGLTLMYHLECPGSRFERGSGQIKSPRGGQTLLGQLREAAVPVSPHQRSFTVNHDANSAGQVVDELWTTVWCLQCRSTWGYLVGLPAAQAPRARMYHGTVLACRFACSRLMAAQGAQVMVSLGSRCTHSWLCTSEYQHMQVKGLLATVILNGTARDKCTGELTAECNGGDWRVG